LSQAARHRVISSGQSNATACIQASCTTAVRLWWKRIMSIERTFLLAPKDAIPMSKG